MKFKMNILSYDILFNIIHKSALYIAIEYENIDIVRLLLDNEFLDINQKYIKINIFFINEITNHLLTIKL